MSKSLNNTILLSDEPEVVKAKLKKAVTDPQKIRKGDPGHPEICLVFSYHKKFNPDEIPEIEKDADRRIRMFRLQDELYIKNFYFLRTDN